MKNPIISENLEKIERPWNIIARIAGYAVVIPVIALTIVFWSTGSVENVGSLALFSLFITPLVGVFVFLTGLVYRWSRGAGIHTETIGIIALFVWIFPTIVFVTIGR